MKKSLNAAILLLIFLMIASVGPSKAQEPDTSNPSKTTGAAKRPEYALGEVIVKFKPVVSLAAAQTVATKNSLEQSAGIQISEVNPLLRLSDGKRLTDIPMLNQYSILKVAQDVDIEIAARKLTENPYVEFAVPNYILRITEIPNDTYFSNQWVLRNDIWANLRVEDAWDITTGSSDAIVAVLDTGLDIGHPDLDSKNTFTGRNFVAAPPNSDIQDDHGHGTAVAGIIAAESDNGQGVAGVSWGAKIMPVKVCDWKGDCYLDESVNGIVWAADNGADIINMSYGVNNPTGFGVIILEDAVDYAYGKNVVMITGAGNNSQRLDSSDADYHIPAELDHVIAVGATNEHDERCDDSDYLDKDPTKGTCGWGLRPCPDRDPNSSGWGPELDVVAPGSNTIWTTDIQGGPGVIPECDPKPSPHGFDDGDYYGSFSGTSAAAPFVSGLAALILSVDSSLTPDEVENIIERNAVDLGAPGRDDYYGWGRINAFNSVKAASPIPIPPPAPVPPSPVDSATFLSHITLPDGSVVSPGEALVKTWQVQNSGTSTWEGYKLKFASGDQMSAPTERSIPTTGPEDTVDISINLTAPTHPGDYNGYFQIVNVSGKVPGGRLSVKISVPAGPEPTPPPGDGTEEIEVQNVEYPSVVTPNEPFRPRVTVKVNGGQLLESRGDMLRNTDGNLYGAWPHVAVVGTVNAGQTYTFEFYEDNPITAPSGEGTYESKWRVWRDGNWAGPEITIRFDVRIDGGTRPGPPTLVSPYNWYVSRDGSTPTLCASAPAGLQYYFQIYESHDIPESGWISNNCWTPPGLGPYVYQWHVQVRDPDWLSIT